MHFFSLQPGSFCENRGADREGRGPNFEARNDLSGDEVSITGISCCIRICMTNGGATEPGGLLST